MDAVAEIPIIAPEPLAECATIARAAKAFGLSEKAIERKIESGTWIEGRHYHRAKDGRTYIDIPGVTRWVRQGV